HPRNDAVPQDPAIPPHEWETLLDEGIGDMERLVARFEKDGAGFLDDVPKKLLPDLYYLGDFHGIAVYGFFVSDRFVTVNAPGGEGLRKFVQSRLGQLDPRLPHPSAILLTSADFADFAGLADLLVDHPCPVVAPSKAREAIERSCPAGTTIV